MLQWISALYGPFFDGSNWAAVIQSGSDWLVILSLAIIECLLSVDNAVVLAAQTQALPTKIQREKSLFYGIWGAYLFRFLIIGVGTFLINFWVIKIIGGLYLLYLAYSFFSKTKVVHTRRLANEKKKRRISLFWSVVIQIEMMDIISSVDSVLASLAISSNPVIVLLGGMIGIAAMRGVAEVIMRLMSKIPEIQPMAYILIIFIAIKLVISIPTINIEIPAPVFGVIVLVAVVITIIIHFVRKNRRSQYERDNHPGES